ncbi:MAG: LysM peptidoglycan-binding domain-containing protein [Pedosphaera sp.]|nr:LysM peptidoglycan-binding domain-containing protein [Pedosphaera sp.]
MNTNPILPPGAKFEQNTGRSNMRMAVLVIALLHIALLTGILFNACKQKDSGKVSANENKIEIPPPLVTPAPIDPVIPPVAVLPGGPTAPGGINVIPPPNVVTSIPEPPVNVATSEHVIAKGDSFFTLAKKYKVSSDAIVKANPDVVPTRLRIGQKVKVPTSVASTTKPATTDDVDAYLVKGGDSLSKIAQRTGTTVKGLRDLNKLSSDRINAGQKLKLPQSAKANTTSKPANSTTSLPAAPGDSALTIPITPPPTGIVPPPPVE